MLAHAYIMLLARVYKYRRACTYTHVNILVRASNYYYYWRAHIIMTGAHLYNYWRATI